MQRFGACSVQESDAHTACNVLVRVQYKKVRTCDRVRGHVFFLCSSLFVCFDEGALDEGAQLSRP